MALGKRSSEQQEMWILVSELPRSPGHPFYSKLNELLAEADFDHWVEKLCERHYVKGKGRPGIPPGVYFRMLLAGYFEGIQSQRGIAWRCSDSLSVRSFLGIPVEKETPHHSSLTRVRKRLPLEVHNEVFLFVLRIANEKGLIKGKTIAVDASTIEANAAMKSIVRRDTGEDYKEYLRGLMEEEGIADPSDEDLRRFDKKRKGKKVSNEDWRSSTDPSSRITKMKDGRTHLGYKVQNTVDLDTDMILAAEVLRGDIGDAESLPDTAFLAQLNLGDCGADVMIDDVVGDKGYHSAEVLAELAEMGLRSYIPESERKHKRKWVDKPAAYKKAVYDNRRRLRGRRSKALQRLRSEFVERSFAHICETGNGRRTWLRGFGAVAKRYLIQAASRNLGVILRRLFGVGSARSLQGGDGGVFLALFELLDAIWRTMITPRRERADTSRPTRIAYRIRPAAA